MSEELGYFPPKGTKFPWKEKTLNYSPWVCSLDDHVGLQWPASVVCRVDLLDGIYRYSVEITDWKHNKSRLDGPAYNAIQAVAKAEHIGEREAKKLLPSWVKKALAEGWRPPG